MNGPDNLGVEKGRHCLQLPLPLPSVNRMEPLSSSSVGLSCQRTSRILRAYHLLGVTPLPPPPMVGTHAFHGRGQLSPRWAAAFPGAEPPPSDLARPPRLLLLLLCYYTVSPGPAGQIPLGEAPARIAEPFFNPPLFLAARSGHGSAGDPESAGIIARSGEAGLGAAENPKRGSWNADSSNAALEMEAPQRSAPAAAAAVPAYPRSPRGVAAEPPLERAFHRKRPDTASLAVVMLLLLLSGLPLNLEEKGGGEKKGCGSSSLPIDGTARHRIAISPALT